MPIADRQTKRRADTRREILEAAWAAAEERGLSALTLRDVADRVGMRAPSLYSHFDSKNAIYDAMFGQAWASYLDVVNALELPDSPRATLKLVATAFFDFAVSNLARHQLMNLRSIPGFAPSPESYAPAVEVLERLQALLTRIGVHDEQGTDLLTALIAGLIDQQLANDPGGTRWRRLLDRTVDMYANEMGLPQERPEERP